MNYMYYQPQQTSNQSETILAYVNGIEGAKSFQVPMNRSALLMDSEKDMFYLKTVNYLGQSTIKCYQFKEIQEPKETEKATKKEIDEINERIDHLIKLIEENKENA